MAGTDERKPVTVLFADLAGSTELATRHDPEHLRALLSAFFDVPRVHEDDAERAVRAAVAMVQSLGQLNPMFQQEYGIRLALRIGVATGEAVAATESVKEFLVTGDVANLAARLQGAGEGHPVASRAGPDPPGLRPVPAGRRSRRRANADRAGAGSLRADRRHRVGP